MDEDEDWMPDDDFIGRIDIVTDAEREAGETPVLLFDHRDQPILVRKVKVIGYVR